MSDIKITAADINDDDRHNFSDMFKEVNGFRPRHTPDDQEIADLINYYPTAMEIQREEDENELQHLREKHGMNFTSLMDYYAQLEAIEAREYEEAQQKRAEELKLKAELSDPRSPRMAVELWDHGDELLIVE